MSLNAHVNVMKVSNSCKASAGNVKTRGRRYRHRHVPLIISNEDKGINQALLPDEIQLVLRPAGPTRVTQKSAEEEHIKEPSPPPTAPGD
ncbi:hypothetical protein PtB15_4B537 [Puccinia triticina]|nr:hypothetical protein PtB15_4B537 [Puccinia triticina]